MQCHIWNCHIYCYSWQLLLLRNQEKWVLLIFSLGKLLKRRINFCTFVIFEKMYFQVKCCVICVLERLTAVDWIKSAFLYLTLFRLAFVWFVATLQYYLGKVVHLSSGCCFNKATFIRYFPICLDNIGNNIEHFTLLRYIPKICHSESASKCFETCVMWPTFLVIHNANGKVHLFNDFEKSTCKCYHNVSPFARLIGLARVVSNLLFKTTYSK